MRPKKLKASHIVWPLWGSFRHESQSVTCMAPSNTAFISPQLPRASRTRRLWWETGVHGGLGTGHMVLHSPPVRTLLSPSSSSPPPSRANLLLLPQHHAALPPASPTLTCPVSAERPLSVTRCASWGRCPVNVSILSCDTASGPFPCLLMYSQRMCVILHQETVSAGLQNPGKAAQGICPIVVRGGEKYRAGGWLPSPRPRPPAVLTSSPA